MARPPCSRTAPQRTHPSGEEHCLFFQCHHSQAKLADLCSAQQLPAKQTTNATLAPAKLLVEVVVITNLSSLMLTAAGNGCVTAGERSNMKAHGGPPHKKRQFEAGPPRNSGNQRQTNYASGYVSDKKAVLLMSGPIDTNSVHAPVYGLTHKCSNNIEMCIDCASCLLACITVCIKQCLRCCMHPRL